MFFSELTLSRMEAAEAKARYTAGAFGEHFEAGSALVGALEGLEATLVLSRQKEETNEALETLARRAGELHRDLKFLIRADDQDFVYYVEHRGRGLFLRASPIDVSRIAKEALFDRMRTTVLTSATLAVDGSFEYFRSRLDRKSVV